MTTSRSRLAALFTALSVTTLHPAVADQSQMHQRCLEARDYQGCMRYSSKAESSPKSTTAQERCFSDGSCIAGKGKDMLGWPKISGFRYREYPKEMYVTYSPPTPLRVSVRGSLDRYITSRIIYRRYRQARASKPSTRITLGDGKSTTECNVDGTIRTDSYPIWPQVSSSMHSTLDADINCETTPPVTFQSSGTPGRAAGVYQTTVDWIYDCKDKTYAYHRDNQIRGKWKPLDHSSYGFLRRWCSRIDTLRVSDFSGYR
jgi:hypothetical protein